MSNKFCHINSKNDLCVTGHVDFTNVVEMNSIGEKYINGLQDVSVDLSGLSSADSSSLAMLVSWIRCAKSQHKAIVFKNVPQPILDLGRVCGLDAILPIGNPLQLHDEFSGS